MKPSPIQSTTQKLRKAIEERDLRAFRLNHQFLVNFCRKQLFEANKPILKGIYPELSGLLIEFYRSQQPEWPEVDRQMGGVEVLRSLVGNLMETRTLDEALADVRASQPDMNLVEQLHLEGHGILSGQIAKRLDVAPNVITNRLPGLEKKGVIARAKRGKNSWVYLTPKGKDIARTLFEDVKDSSEKEVETIEFEPFMSPVGIKQSPDQSPQFFY